jgi:Acetyltransferase (GNAT) family.
VIVFNGIRKYRGLGIGAMLMATLVGYAREWGYAEIQW